MNEKNKIQGVIEEITQRTKNYSIQIQNEQYSDFGTCPYTKGDKINLTFEQNGNFKNITKIEQDTTITNTYKAAENNEETMKKQEYTQHIFLNYKPNDETYLQLCALAKKLGMRKSSLTKLAIAKLVENGI